MELGDNGQHKKVYKAFYYLKTTKNIATYFKIHKAKTKITLTTQK